MFDNNIYGFRCFRSRNNGKNEDKSSPCCRPCADDDNVDELYVDTVNKPTNGEQPAPRNKVQNAYHNQLSRQLKQVNNGQCNADDDGLEPSSGTRPASPAESFDSYESPTGAECSNCDPSDNSRVSDEREVYQNVDSIRRNQNKPTRKPMINVYANTDD